MSSKARTSVAGLSFEGCVEALPPLKEKEIMVGCSSANSLTQLHALPSETPSRVVAVRMEIILITEEHGYSRRDLFSHRKEVPTSGRDKSVLDIDSWFPECERHL